VESPRSHSGVEKDLYSIAWIMKDIDLRGPRIIHSHRDRKEGIFLTHVLRESTQSIGSRRTMVQDLG
jgi:hypothetical protein